MIKLPEKWIEDAFFEDAPFGDPASELVSILRSDTSIKGRILSKDSGTVCGLSLIEQFFSYLDTATRINFQAQDGDQVNAGETLCEIQCSSYAMLRCERIVLNMLSYLSGIATQSRLLANIIAPYGVKLLDTRKILPHYRLLVKYAVRTGGAYNHRHSLSDLIMLKDNHIQVAGGISKLMELCNTRNRHPMLKIEIEVSNIYEAQEALKYSPDIIMLDNFTVEEAKTAIKELKGKVKIEISGGITIDTIESYARCEPDYISTGSITHHVKGIDFSLETA